MKITNIFSAPFMWPLLGLCLLVSTPPSYAEDVEIYFSQEGGNSGRILFLLDTSGSMAFCDELEWDDDGCDLSEHRMTQLKSAFSSLINSLSGDVHVGVGRFNEGGLTNGGYEANGGRIIYPVRALDEKDYDGPTLASVRDKGGDVADDGLELEREAFHIQFPSAGRDGGSSAFVFENLGVPRNAQIEEAHVIINPTANTSQGLDVVAEYQTVPSASLFSDSETSITDRSWTAPPGAGTIRLRGQWRQYEKEKLDVTEVVRAAIQRPDWCGGNGLALRFRNDDADDSSYRWIGTIESGRPAKLEVHWDRNASPNTNATSDESDFACGNTPTQIVEEGEDDGFEELAGGNVDLSGGEMRVEKDTAVAGVRFADVPFEPEATLGLSDQLKRATLHLRQVSPESGSAAAATISIRRIGNAASRFNPGATGDLSSRPTGSAQATYSVPAWQDGSDGWHEVDVTDLLIEALGTPSWNAGDDLAFLISASNGAVRLETRESSRGSAPYLTVTMSGSDIEDFVPLVRDELTDRVLALSAEGGTPLIESYTEMGRYMMGMSPNFGGASDTDAPWLQGSPQKYASPLADVGECESGSVVVMTDGEPSFDGGASGQVQNIAHESCDSSFGCGEAMADWLYRLPDDDGSDPADYNGIDEEIAEKRVRTHTVGFYLDDDQLADMKALADEGHGKHASADSAESLEDAFRSITLSAIVEDAAMAAPGVSVNQLNRFEFLNQLYFGVFKPSSESRWEGNLKRYAIDNSVSPPELVDQDDQVAIDSSTGYFRETAQSFWSDEVDGDQVTVGGASGELGDGTRNLFVLLDNPGVGSGATATSDSGSSEPTAFTEFDSVAAEKLGLPADADEDRRQELFDFLMQSWGDPLHSVPRLVNYGFVDGATREEAFADPTKQVNTIFVSTNDGMLHAIDAADGSEHFAFMPAETLAGTAQRAPSSNVDVNPISRSTYGLDGTWTPWRIGNRDGEAEHVYLFGGMRRGGRNYYALDVSDVDAPRVMWSIQGGEGDYGNLGQTWSEPTLTRVRIDGTSVPVLVFGGGYDPGGHDDADTLSGGDIMGNSIYLVNAYTGDLVAEVTESDNADMKWSIPSSISVVDYDLDGHADFLYGTDLGGQVFRVDLDNGADSAGDLVERTETVAKLGTSENAGTLADHRRFFASPVIALDENRDLRVAIGSGYRVHPLGSNTRDRFYVFRDGGAGDVMHGRSYSDPDAVTTSDLVDVTTDLAPDSDTRDAIDNGAGWYLNLAVSEKVLAPASILAGRVYFTSYVPETDPDSPCAAALGRSRLYAVNMADGTPAVDFDNDGTVTDGRYEETSLPGIPPQPQPVLGLDGGGSGGDGGGGGGGGGGDPCAGGTRVDIIVGTEVIEGGKLKGCGLHKTRWYELKNDSAVEAVLDQHGAEQ